MFFFREKFLLSLSLSIHWGVKRSIEGGAFIPIIHHLTLIFGFFLTVLLGYYVSLREEMANSNYRGLEAISLSNVDGTTRAIVTLHGAHVVDLVLRGQPVLFVSSKAIFDGVKPIRGGIPIIWPQFSNRGPISSHGFARNMKWSVVSVEGSKCTLQLEDNEATLKVWPHPFLIRYVVELTADAMALEFQVHPKGNHDISFTFALHSYFVVPDIGAVRVNGLQGIRFQDHLQKMQEGLENSSSLAFVQEVDRTYMKVPASLTITRGDGTTVVLDTSRNLSDAVVWNPWIEKSSKMADFEGGEYKRMVCVEVGEVTHPVILKGTDSTWTAKHVISLQHQSRSSI